MRSKAIASMRSSPDPVATLRDAWRRARESLSFTSVRGRQETGTHHLHIGDYSTVSMVCNKHDEGIESKPFRAGGHRVDLRLMHTRFGSITKNATAGLTIGFLDRDGNLLWSGCVQPLEYMSWAGSTDIRIAVTEENKQALRRLKDDSLVVRYELTVHSLENKESKLRWLLRRFLD